MNENSDGARAVPKAAQGYRTIFDPTGRTDAIGLPTAKPIGLSPRRIAGERVRIVLYQVELNGEPFVNLPQGRSKVRFAEDDRVAEALARLAEDR